MKTINVLKQCVFILFFFSLSGCASRTSFVVDDNNFSILRNGQIIQGGQPSNVLFVSFDGKELYHGSLSFIYNAEYKVPLGKHNLITQIRYDNENSENPTILYEALFSFPIELTKQETYYFKATREGLYSHGWLENSKRERVTNIQKVALKSIQVSPVMYYP